MAACGTSHTFLNNFLGLNVQMLNAKYFRKYHIYEDVGIQLFCQAFTDSKKGWVQTSGVSNKHQLKYIP